MRFRSATLPHAARSTVGFSPKKLRSPFYFFRLLIMHSWGRVSRKDMFKKASNITRDEQWNAMANVMTKEGLGRENHVCAQGG